MTDTSDLKTTEPDWIALAEVGYTAAQATLVPGMRGPTWANLDTTQALVWANAAEAIYRAALSPAPAAPAPSTTGAGEADIWPGVEAAARYVDKVRATHDAAHGYHDPETGSFEYGRGPHAEAKADYSDALAELADEIRALSAPAPEQREDTTKFLTLLLDARHRIANLSRAAIPFSDPLDGPVLRRIDGAIDSIRAARKAEGGE